MIGNPLPVGRYVVDLFTPTASTPGVRDGVPIFRRWRQSNAARVRVVHAETWDTSPRKTRVQFEVEAPPGAWPFAQLGPPAHAAEVGAVPTIADAVAFLFDPLGALEGKAASAAAHFLAQQASPELRELNAAISVTRANIAIIRATLEAVRNGTAPNPVAAVAAAKSLARQSLELLTAAMGAVTVDFPRRKVSELIADLHAFEQAIEAAPANAFKALAQAASDVAVPFEAANLGALVFGAAALWAVTKKRSDATDLGMAVGAAMLLLGGSTLVDNLLHPFDHAGKAARILKGQ